MMKDLVIKLLRKIKHGGWVLRYIIPTIYFNFHYLPFRQAILLPIWLRNPKLLKCEGSIRIVVWGGVGTTWHDQTRGICSFNISKLRDND